MEEPAAVPLEQMAYRAATRKTFAVVVVVVVDNQRVVALALDMRALALQAPNFKVEPHVVIRVSVAAAEDTTAAEEGVVRMGDMVPAAAAAPGTS